jgi:hypothetical protein
VLWERDVCCGLWEREEGGGDKIGHAWVSGWGRMGEGLFFIK